MYRIAVCEDEAAMRESLCAQCRQVTEELDILCELTEFSSAEALEAALSHRADAFDLLLLDIQLGGKTGLDFARERRRLDDRVSIIFTTSCEEYLRDGYEVQPVRFLLKPVTLDTLRTAIQTDWRLHHEAERVALRDGAHTVVVPLREAVYIESRNHTTLVHPIKGEQALRMPLANAEQALPPGRFCRCHNSFLVNFAYIAEFRRTEVLLRTGERLPVGRKYHPDAQNAFIRYINR